MERLDQISILFSGLIKKVNGDIQSGIQKSRTKTLVPLPPCLTPFQPILCPTFAR